MAGITTHVLDTALGRPAAAVPVTLELKGDDGAWTLVGRGATDADGRLRELTRDHAMRRGVYRITFDTSAYFAASPARGAAAPFYPSVSIDFFVAEPAEHFHVPLLLSPFGYSTYRGS
jgi:5-hydroxyisourate hydrolase